MEQGLRKSSQDSGHCDSDSFDSGTDRQVCVMATGVYRFRKSRPLEKHSCIRSIQIFVSRAKKSVEINSGFFDSAKNKHSASSKNIRPKTQKSTKSRVRKSLNGKEWKPYLISTRHILKASPPRPRSLKGFWMWSAAWKKARCL